MKEDRPANYSPSLLLEINHKKLDMKKISIVIPIFNEELIVEELIRRLQGATKNLIEGWAILIEENVFLN